jgi:protein associated with RNAse G/E
MINVEKKLAVHAYKFNGVLYRSWEFPLVLVETDKYLCLDLQNTKVITTHDGKRFFHSKLVRPTIWYLFKDE